MYEIKDYNNRIKRQMEVLGDDPKNITITLNKATGKTEIELKGGYKVDFTKDNTWRECLGFESIKLERDGIYGICACGRHCTLAVCIHGL